MNCKWCKKYFKPSKKYKKYCSIFCRNNGNKVYSKKKKKNFLKTYYWSPLQQKSVLLKSSYELTYVEYLSLRGIEWLYEPKRFYMSDEKTYYLPDFYLPQKNEWHEIKGRWYRHSLSKYEQFLKLYPEETIKIIGTKEIMEMRKELRGLLLCQGI